MRIVLAVALVSVLAVIAAAWWWWPRSHAAHAAPAAAVAAGPFTVAVAGEELRVTAADVPIEGARVTVAADGSAPAEAAELGGGRYRAEGLDGHVHVEVLTVDGRRGTAALGGDHGAGGSDIAWWTCSMHPEVRAREKGLCPKCKMDLTAVTREDLASGTVRVEEHRLRQIGVRVAATERRELTRTLRLAATVSWDRARVAEVTTRAPGWVSTLAVAGSGEHVRAGQPLFTLYSPELVAAQGEFLAARRSGDAALTKAALGRLARLGMDDKAIAAVGEAGVASEAIAVTSPIDGVVAEQRLATGARLEAGAPAMLVADPAALWVEAIVHEEEASLVTPGLGATVRVDLPAPRTWTGKVAVLAAEADPVARTRRARIPLAIPDGALVPGTAAVVVIEVPLGERLAVPDDAVIVAGDRRVVFRDLGDGRFRPVEVRTGVRAGGWTEILDGLEPGAPVAASGVFLLASESRIRTGTDAW